MSNIVPFDTAIPTHLANRVGQPSALADSIVGGIGGGGPSYPRISIKGSRFRVVKDGVETVLPDTTLPVVIVGANAKLAKAFYATAWSPDADATGPDCYTHEGTRPAADSPQPQNDLCASCPHNAFGSKVTDNGTKIKACSDTKRLAVVAASAPDGDVYLLNVTASALKGLTQYQRELTMRGIASEIVTTIVSFDTTASFPKLKFDFGGYLVDAQQAIVDTLFGSEKIKEITGEVAAGLVALPVATPVAASPAVVEPTPEPVAAFGQPAAPVAEPTPEPVASFGQPVAAPAPAVAAVAPEPVAEPVAAPTAATSGLADEITALMAEVADDA